jgi:16S rRNA (guanine527-N7)-methyltransferase
VAQMETFVHWVKGCRAKNNKHVFKNEILYQKGGNIEEELAHYKTAKIFPLDNFFEEEYYVTKCV